MHRENVRAWLKNTFRKLFYDAVVGRATRLIHRPGAVTTTISAVNVRRSPLSCVFQLYTNAGRPFAGLLPVCNFILANSYPVLPTPRGAFYLLSIPRPHVARNGKEQRSYKWISIGIYEAVKNSSANRLRPSTYVHSHVNWSYPVMVQGCW